MTYCIPYSFRDRLIKSKISSIFRKPESGVWLVWAGVVLVPFGRSVEIAVGLMALMGIYLAWKHKHRVCWQGGAQLYSTVFALVWVAVLLSLPNAVNPAETVRIIVSLPRFYFAGIYTIFVLSSPESHHRLLLLVAWLLLFWLLDASVQSLADVDLFGRLNGIFGSDYLKLGLLLPIFAPFLIEYMRGRWNTYVLVVVCFVLLVIDLLVGSRAGWIMLALLAITYLIIFSRDKTYSWGKVVMLSVVLMGSGLTTAFYTSDDFSDRVDQSLLVFSGNTADIDYALSLRLPIWNTAQAMIKENPVNGVGARGFRYAYRSYASEGDPHVSDSLATGALHSHHLVLEILAETGITGFIAWIIGLFLLLRAWQKAGPDERVGMRAPGLALMLGFFPLNTHFAIYSSFWSQIVWWLIAAYCAGYQPRRLGVTPK